MSLYNDFETNKESEKNGVRVEYGANKDGSIPTFIVSRMSRTNKEYLKAVDRNTKPHRRSIELETIKPEVAEKINMQTFVDAILLGWENVQNRGGIAIPFSKEAAKKLFEDLPDLYEDLSEKAKKASTFKDEVAEEEAKN